MCTPARARAELRLCGTSLTFALTGSPGAKAASADGAAGSAGGGSASVTVRAGLETHPFSTIRTFDTRSWTSCGSSSGCVAVTVPTMTSVRVESVRCVSVPRALRADFAVPGHGSRPDTSPAAA